MQTYHNVMYVISEKKVKNNSFASIYLYFKYFAGVGFFFSFEQNKLTTAVNLELLIT